MKTESEEILQEKPTEFTKPRLSIVEDAGDLRREIVRRRAVFRWTDTPHLGRELKYAIQKISMRGSTHFPDFVAINVDG